ncbi:MAG: Iron-sulfur assembly protein 1 [Candelina mexicana]|nr:MAG: Iron-sulfur assembly protein 1 [Candelina mexicana]
MPLQRLVAPLTLSSPAANKFVSTLVIFASHTCWHRIPSSQHSWYSSRRRLQTATTLGSGTPEPQPAPPRNAGVPDTSIAGGVPQIHNTIPPEVGQQHTLAPRVPEEQGLTVSLTEGEAQKSKPPATTATSTATPSRSSGSSVETSKRSKLRARKAAMTLTPSATAQLRNLLSQPEPRLIRVGVKNRGCSGLAYSLEYVEKPGSFDETVEQDGVKVLIDSKALFSIIGSEMDWVEDKLNQRFIFRNPNISKSNHQIRDLTDG